MFDVRFLIVDLDDKWQVLAGRVGEAIAKPTVRGMVRCALLDAPYFLGKKYVDKSNMSEL